MAGKLINDPGLVVQEMLEGLVAVHDSLTLLDGFDQDIKVVCNTSSLVEVGFGLVAVISGGGSGHEPAHAGYVGDGMLSAAVCGDVFASPSTDAILCAIRAVTGPAGCLLVVKNYTGDRLNFGMAAEQAKCEGLAVEMVIVGDDVGVRSPGIAGRRGIAGTVFVHKVAGAAAAAAMPLASVLEVAARAARNVASMGAALTSCTLPGAMPSTRIPAGHMELGLGIHGEPGAEQCALEAADAVVGRLLGSLLGPACPLSGPSWAGARVALMVNNLGGTTAMELHVCARHALKLLEKAGVLVERVLVGSFMTALDMAGVSLSLFVVDDAALALLDAPSSASAWPRALAQPSLSKRRAPVALTHASADPVSTPQEPRTDAGRALRSAVRSCAKACVEAEAALTAADEKVGDGDCGATFKRAGETILERSDTLPFDSPPAAALALAALVGRNVGGTSGAMYQIFFTAAAKTLAAGAAAAAGSAEAYPALLLKLIAVRCLHSCFLFDTNGFITDERFERVLSPLVGQLAAAAPPAEIQRWLEVEAPATGLDGKLALGGSSKLDVIGAAVSAALVQLAVTANNDALWKRLNHRVLLVTRSECAASRLCAVEIVYNLVDRLREEYLVLLPEALPFLSELMEDSDSAVEARTQQVIKLLEDLSEEKLDDYLKP